MPLRLIYDPIRGMPIRDGDVDQYVETIIRTHAESVLEFDVASELLITAIRAAVHAGRIVPTHIQLLFRPHTQDDMGVMREQPLQELRIDDDGRIDHWPIGFCDNIDKYLMELIDWDR